VIGTFRANNHVNNFLLLLYGIVLKLPIFIHPNIPEAQKIDGFLFKQLLISLQVVGASFPIIYSIITFVLLFAQAVLLNTLANNQKLFTSPNYLPGMTYLLITSCFTEWHALSAPLIINTIGIWTITQISNMHNAQNVKTGLYNIGLVVGVGTFFFFPSVAFILLMLFGLATMRPFKITEWLIAFLGSITPYYFLLLLVFLTDKWQGYKFPGVAFSTPLFTQNGLAYIGIGMVLATALFGFVLANQNFRRQLIQSRKSWNLIFLYILIAACIPFINATKTFSYWVVCAVPLSFLSAAYFFYIKNKWITLFTHWAIVAYIIAISYLLIK
jgi:hypothetical protein